MADIVILCAPDTIPELQLGDPDQENILQIDLPLSEEEKWLRDRHGCRQLVVEVEDWPNLDAFMQYIQAWWPGPPLTDPRPPLTLIHRDFASIANLQETADTAAHLWGATVTTVAKPAEWRAMVPTAAREPLPAVPAVPAAAPPVPDMPPPPAPAVPLDGVVGKMPFPAGYRAGTLNQAPAAASPALPRVVLVWGQEGGVGTTQIARGLAHTLADNAPQRGRWQSVLVDFHHNAGLEVLTAGTATPHVGHMLYELDPNAARNTIQGDGRRQDIGIVPGFDIPSATGILNSRGPDEDEQRTWLGEHLRLLNQVAGGHLVLDAPGHLAHLLIHFVDAVVLVSSISRVAGGQLVKNLMWLQRSRLGHHPGAVLWVANGGTARTALQGGPQELVRLLQQYLPAVPQPHVLLHCQEFLRYGSESDYPWNYSAPLRNLLARLSSHIRDLNPISPLHPA